MKKIINVVAAAIIKGDYILALQRSENMTLSGFWEFPGGKIEIGENHETALKREIFEELNADIEVRDFINTAKYDYDFGTVIMSTYKAKLLSETFEMKEHSQYKWLNKYEILEMNWAPVDIPAARILAE